MSRIGLKPLTVPKSVTVSVKDNILTVKGAKGELTQHFEPEVSFEIKDDVATVSRKDDSKRAKSMHGLYRKLLENMVTGVTTGFSKALIINGVGYRAELKGKSLLMNLGFSTQIEYVLPEGITAAVEGNKVTVSGISKEVVGLAASEIRGLRPPEPYKGKGIKYETEHVRRKVGKSGVK
ncbi:MULTISPECIES: 50S ribosomal protein L6 [unclassified Oceanispirochaeta]|uniref:50S ribosomal protein L6 n=1 Tax=unclassified Oceanispirochaeta TaxID=2635722 RepID=UPI000E0902D9|nr:MULTISPECIES: 50S ribosomal protein L6 [unclassified Oceanispirochaeta]MBF9017144.1 50S ribosomal protein L6 [Oceanispirochaeta sp. M2]NPD73593.1 50S ribosomal protein L6 [Oceanispirochaeta sp. M1]RDG30697.1 50S ribosomal protein L6 [Oceanispirochaeta sp. M1]